MSFLQACVLALALSTAAEPPKPPAPELAPRPPIPDGTQLSGPTSSDWLEVKSREGDVDMTVFVADLLRDAFRPSPERKESFEVWLATSQDLGKLQHITIKDGANAGRWYFIYRSGSPIATDVLHVEVAATAPYRVSAEVHCGSTACEGIDEELARFAPPWPSKDAPAEVQDAWRELVATEACVTGPPRQPPPDYPVDEQRRGIEGTTTMALIYNRCGDVRAQWMQQSSGNQAFDLEAVRSVATWRVPVLRPGVSETAMVNVAFRLDDARAKSRKK